MRINSIILKGHNVSYEMMQFGIHDIKIRVKKYYGSLATLRCIFFSIIGIFKVVQWFNVLLNNSRFDMLAITVGQEKIMNSCFITKLEW